jgi:hypothetical protein
MTRRLAGTIYLSEVRLILKERCWCIMIRELVEPSLVGASPNGLLGDPIGFTASGSQTIIPALDHGTIELVGSITNSDVIPSIIGQNRPRRTTS